ncbi:metal ABC transporter substrate-binding protein [Jannaschia sp. R86511]|uniref:metal ABC transporter substrate-binding protein n=1 Tax=Jannaschia sp. R86511 TaxID=3093853 RepID=UPI0036D33580
MTSAPRPALLGTALAAALVLAACGGGTGGDGAGPAAAPVTAVESTGAGDVAAPALSVVAAFYPLQFLAQQVGGDRADVTGLTPPGAEAHDLELSPQSLVGLTESDLVVALGGFQPAVDEALAGTQVPVVDLADVADRELGEDAEPHDHSHDEDADEHADDEHADEEGAAEDDHDHGETDPHFWTDPTHMAEAAQHVAAAMSEADPDGADTYTANADALVAELTTLDEEAQTAFASCEVETLVTAHDAFGYFADRYGFEIRSINGITPDQEPDARAQAEISDFVADSGIRTVYTETLVSAAIAETVAAEAGVDVMVLDPLEGLTDESAGQDYLEVMRANIDAVRSGQACT